MHERYGDDLNLGFFADEAGRSVAGPFSRPDLQPILRMDIRPRETDLGVVSGRANLVQAILLRLKTERGELAQLGMPDYGSRHHRLIGEPNTETTRNLIKLYVLECLRQEPRIEAVLRITVKPGVTREDRDKVDIDLSLQGAELPGPLNLVIPFSLAEA